MPRHEYAAAESFQAALRAQAWAWTFKLEQCKRRIERASWLFRFFGGLFYNWQTLIGAIAGGAKQRQTRCVRAAYTNEAA
jgi:hypothetical protein